FYFFFQAEDGIRDLIVTGVQTCALPICQADQNVVDAPVRLAGVGRVGVAVVPGEARASVTGDAPGVLQVRAATVERGEPAEKARSEERRVGKECRWGWGVGDWRKNVCGV